MLPPRAWIFIGLNAVRALSIISLLLVFSSSIFVLVNDIRAVNRATQSGEDMSDCDYIDGSTVPNQPAGVFWAVVNRLLIIFQVLVLLLSELGWPASFFRTYFPVLGPDFGLGALGLFQCLIGATVLSHHVDDFTLVAAFLLFSLGCLNALLGLFREPVKARRSIMSWRDDAKGRLPSYRDTVRRGPAKFAAAAAATRPGRAASFVGGFFGGDEKEKGGERGFGFGRQGENTAGKKGFVISRPIESMPRYTPTLRPDSSRAGTPEPMFKSSATAL